MQVHGQLYFIKKILKVQFFLIKQDRGKISFWAADQLKSKVHFCIIFNNV